MPLSLNRRYVRRNAIKQRWNASQRCWQGWADRILHVELDGDKLLTGVKKPAKAQQVMRTTGFSTALERALQRIGENAWVLLSDIDEVPRASALSNALLSAEVRRELGRGRTYALAGRSYYYNAECVSQPGSLEDHWIAGPKLLSSESLRSTSWQNLRTYFVQQAVEKRDELILWDASWHFGFLMTAQEQLTKLCLNVAVENRKICAHPKALSLVASASASCQDLWNRSIVPLVREERGTELPAFVREHYPDFARPRHSIHETENLCAHHDSGSGDSKLASTAIDGCRILSRAFRSRCACPFSPPPFTLTAAHPSPPAPPHVCHVQPKHPCIACRTHSAQAAPLPRPEHAHTHRLPCRPHVAGPHVSGPGWRLPGCEETFFGAISTCASASSQRCHVRVRLLPCAVASCYLLSCLAVWPVRGRW